MFSKEALLAQVQNLHDEIRSLYVASNKISCILADISQGTPSTSYPDVIRLRHDWDSLRGEFQDILESSRSLAGQARAAITDFVLFIDTILCNPSYTEFEKVEGIKEYRSGIANYKYRSQDVAERLKNLTTQIQCFREDWKLTTEGKRFGKCKKKVEELRRSLNQLNVKIAILSITFGSAAVLGTALVAVSVLHGCFDPTTVPGILSFASNLFSQLREAIADRSHKKRELQHQVEEMEEMQLGLNNIATVATKLVALCSVWTSITADLTVAQDQIEKIVEDRCSSLEIFQRRMEQIRVSYADLGGVFREYQIVMSSPITI